MSNLWALFLGLGLLMIGNGLNGAVIGVRSETAGFSVVVTGVIMAGYFAGFLLAPSIVVRLLATVGHIRVFAGLAATGSSAVVLHSVWVQPVFWTALRFVFGFCAAGLYIVIESWLNAMSDPRSRGRTLAVYMIVSMGGLGIGQYLIAVAEPDGFRLSVLASVLVSLSLVPVTLAATTKAPVVDAPGKLSIRELLGIVPTGVIGSFMSGAGAGIVLSLSAVYATRIGLSLQRTAFFLVAPTLGGIFFQLPIGRLSDRMSRRAVIFGVALVAAAVCSILMLLPEQSVFVPVMMVVLGGMMYPLYSLVVSYTLDWTPDGKSFAASGTLIRINGSGALVGPLVASVLMAQFGPLWFYWTLTIAFSVVVGYLLWRLLVKEALPMERQRAYVPFPARAGATAIGLVVRPVRKVTKMAVGTKVISRRSADRLADVVRHPAARTSEPGRVDGVSGHGSASGSDDGAI